MSLFETFIADIKDFVKELNLSTKNMVPASNHRPPPFGLSVIMIMLFFGVNAILFFYFQWIKLQKQVNTTDNQDEHNKGKGGKDAHQKELSKPFIGTLDCYINLTSELFRVSLILLMTYICEYLWFFSHSTKTYSRDLFIFVLIIFFGYAFYTIKPIKDLSLLGREQTEEWKGWMQFIFLLYHYFHAEEVYNPVRVMITCYVWMTGFGNFSFFYIKQDFSWLRVIQMLWRLNFSVVLLMWTHQNTWILYYICPMHTFYFFMVYITMYIFSSVNASKWGIRIKLFIVGVLIFIIWDYNHGLFDIVFAFLGTDKVIGANSGSVWEWYFRTSLDHWSTYLGMIFALNFPLCEQFFTKAKGTPLLLTAILMGSITIYWFYYYYPLDKLQYNLTHSYFAIIPLTSYIFFRNITPSIRSGVSMSLHELGKTTLETYLLQHHIWLSSNAKTLWTVIPGNPWINFAFATIIFFIVSKELYRLTMSLRGMILPDDKNIALRNIIGTSLITALCYGLAYAISLFELSVLEISIIVVVLGAVVLAVIGYTLPAGNDQHYHQAIYGRTLRYIGIVLAVLLTAQLVTRERTLYTDPSPVSASVKPALPTFGSSLDCLKEISNGKWIAEPCDAATTATKGHTTTPTTAVSNSAYCMKNEWKWTKEATATCPIQKITSKKSQNIFQNKKIIFFGDSITRESYHSFIHLLDNNYTQKYDYLLKHSSLLHKIEPQNITVQFQWTPYIKNITSEYSNLFIQKKQSYDYVIFGAMFWDALNIHQINDYSNDIKQLSQLLAKTIPTAATTTTTTTTANTTTSTTTTTIPSSASNSEVVRVWLMPTEILNERLPTEEKRLYMNREKISDYRKIIENSFNQTSLKINNIIDGRSVSSHRETTSSDGIHYSEEVYEVIAQMLVNNYYLHFPKYYAAAGKKVVKPYVPKTTGAMSFPDYGAGMLLLAAIMLFTMDSFFGFGFLSLILFGRFFDWDAAYGPYIRKIQANSPAERSDNALPSPVRNADKDAERNFEVVPLMSKDKDSMA